jgi:hypothetical protein
MSLRTALSLTTLAVVATLTAVAPRSAAAQSAVNARLTLVGLANPCISTGELAGSHDVGASCMAASVKPSWGCPDLGPARDRECKYIEQPWPSIDSVYGRVRASNVKGQLRVNSDLVVETQLRPASTPGAAAGYEATAYAAWQDRLDLGATPRTQDMWVAFDLYAHGDQSIAAGGGNLPGSINWDTWTRYTYNFDMNVDPSGAGSSSDWGGQKELRSVGVDSTSRYKSSSLAAHTTVWRFVGMNERYLSFAYNFKSESHVPSVVQANTTDYWITSHVKGDFGSTAGLTGVRFYGADKATELAGIQYSFVNGTQFVGPTTTAPEPATWALMGTGLAALGVVARRRRAVV